MRRVVVIGTTGSGKSTLAERLAAQTGLRVVELDALFWGKDWQPVPLELFRHRVERETKGDGWIVVGNYGQVRDLVWPNADTLIWLDLPLSLVMWRLVRRTVRRARRALCGVSCSRDRHRPDLDFAAFSRERGHSSDVSICTVRF